MARGDSETFDVWLHTRCVGHLHFQNGLTSFEFREDYRGMADRPVLGQIFEDDPRRRWRQAGRVPVWFSNLLPEGGPLLDHIADELDISPRSEMRLLHALGKDLPGAVVVAPSEADVAIVDGVLADEPPRAGSDQGIRFSVAGVQLKLSMVRDGNRLRLAGNDERGSFYVKFAGSFKSVPENEYAMMQAAGLSGITVPDIDLNDGGSLPDLAPSFAHYAQQRVFVIRRFDRTESGPVHIEDLNQVVGGWPEAKYRNASYERLGLLIRSLCGDEDFIEFLRRLAFCVLIGNEDAHLKNWSLHYPDRRSPRLAPAYDLVSTIQYDDLERGMALNLQGTKSPESVALDTFDSLAEFAGYEGPEQPSSVVREVIERFRSGIHDVRAESPLDDSFWDRLSSYQSTLRLID